jgi:hypothetical protein
LVRDSYIEALEGAISIRLYPRLCPGEKTKRSRAFYEAYREAWHLLKQPETSETAPNIQNGTNRAAVANAANVTNQDAAGNAERAT